MSSRASFFRVFGEPAAQSGIVRSIACGVAMLAAFTVRGVDSGATLPGQRLTALAAAPLYFEANQDRLQNASQFIARGRDFNALISPTEATLVLARRETSVSDSMLTQPMPARVETRAVRIRLVGANPGACVTGLNQLPARVNYFIGSDPAGWRSRVPLFSTVQVNDVYAGVRLVFYGNQSARLEYDFVLEPNAKPEQIQFRIEGADGVRVDADGSLVMKIGTDEVRQHPPVIYQNASSERRQIQGAYRLVNANTAGFRVGDYDHSLPLVIDPTLSFSSFLGGSKLDIGWSIALDSDGNIYIAGETLSKKLPTTAGALAPAYQGGTHGFGDAFVAKYDAGGSNLLYLTYLGGKTDDGALGLAVDGGGNAYITGFTDSKNFPIVPANAIRTALTGKNNNALHLFPIDAFVAKLDPTGSSLLYSTLLGGDGRDEGVGIAVDNSGIAYVTGLTESTNFYPISINAFQTNFLGNADVFVAKIIDGATFGFSTFLGGSNQEFGESIAVDSGGSAYVTGFTHSTNFPTLNAITFGGVSYTNLNTLTNSTSRTDAFVTRLSPDGSALLFSTYLGGINDDAGQHLTLDAAGNAFVTGYTYSTNFPVSVIPTPKSAATNFTSHTFLAKMNGNGGLIYSTQFGGSRSDQGTGVAVDSAGNAYVAGFTSSADFFATNTYTNLRTTNSLVRGRKGTNDVFVAVLDPSASTFVHSVILGGFGNDQANGIAVEPSGSSVSIVGQTTSADFPLVNPQQAQLGAVKKSKENDAFVGKIQFP